MLTREQLQGVLLSLAKTEITVNRNEENIVGYTVRLRVHFRSNIEFLTSIQRTLLQYGVETLLKDRESKVRPRPILYVGKIMYVKMLSDIVPALPDHRNQWVGFKRAVDIVCDGGHHSQEGIDEILQIKGVL
tara:strand:+ start:11459 stop:11854 length:396 start_codon:yes stop_codon:yes gene_type:complete